MSDSPNPQLRIEISADQRTATLIAEAAVLKTPWDVAELGKLCTAAGLPATPELQQRLTELKDAASRPAGVSQFEIAKATPPVDTQSASLLFTQGNGVVKTGDVLGQMEPARRGKNGVDVLGKPIPHGTAVDAIPTIPPGIRNDNGKLVAERDGYFLSDGALSKIDPIVEVPSIDPATRSINFDRTTLVHGNIGKNVGVTAKQSLIIDGSVDATVITVGHDMRVQGIFGRDSGRYTVGRELHAQFLRQASVIVGEDLFVKDDIVESDVISTGRVVIPEGEIRGGRVHAASGVEAKSLGSDSYTKTTIEIGLDLVCDKLLEKKRNAIVAGRRHVEQVRLHIAPLMANPKRLTNQQKEKATELLFEADELQARIEADITELRNAVQVATTRAQSSLTVHGAIHAGVTLKFQGVETTIRSTLHGPIRVVALDFSTKPRIVAYHGTNPTPQPLESRATQYNLFTEFRRLAA